MARTVPAEMASVDEGLDVGVVYDEHADFVWRSLHRLGVAPADLPDLLHDVFVVVHRRRAEFDATRPLRGWLWGIALGLVRNYRRRQRRRDAVEPVERNAEGPESAFLRKRRQTRGQRLLEALDPEKRAVFVMFELEGLSGKRIAELLELPLGTVHSRLHAARRELTSGLEGDGSDE